MIEKGLVYGRFQILHLKHVAYILAAKMRCKRLYLGITLSDDLHVSGGEEDNYRVRRSANPLTYIERYEMLRDTLLSFGVPREEFEIIPFPIDRVEYLGQYLPEGAVCFMSICDEWTANNEKRFEKLGYKIYATRSTAKYLQEHGVNALRVNKISQESPNVMDLILGHKIDLVIDTPTQGNGDKNRDGFLIRRNAIETGVYCITAMDTANALAQSLETATNELTPIDIATVKNL